MTMSREISHALVFNLHQPAGNLDELLREQPWEARQIPLGPGPHPAFLWRYEDIGRVHLALSGTPAGDAGGPGPVPRRGA